MMGRVRHERADELLYKNSLTHSEYAKRLGYLFVLGLVQ